MLNLLKLVDEWVSCSINKLTWKHKTTQANGTSINFYLLFPEQSLNFGSANTEASTQLHLSKRSNIASFV